MRAEASGAEVSGAEVSVLASYRFRSIAFKGSLAATRSSSDRIRAEKLVVGASSIEGWAIESASGDSEEAMSAWAAAVSASVGARSMSELAD